MESKTEQKDTRGKLLTPAELARATETAVALGVKAQRATSRDESRDTERRSSER
jgi:hypothetical protein